MIEVTVKSTHRVTPVQFHGGFMWAVQPDGTLVITSTDDVLGQFAAGYWQSVRRRGE